MPEKLRGLIPASQLTPENIDSMREYAERVAIDEWVRRNGLSRDQCISQNLLPFTHLALGTVDVWRSGAMVANTVLAYISHILDDDEVVTIYGAAIEDANPSTSTISVQKAGTTIYAVWDMTPIYCDLYPVGYTDKPALWSGREQVVVNLLPRITKAGGEVVVLLGIMVAKLGKFLTK